MKEHDTAINATLFQRVLVFTLTFLVYVGLHSIRTAWAYSKTQISISAHIDQKFFGLCDAVYLLVYSFGLAILSPLIGKIPVNWFIGVGMILASLSFSSMALAFATQGHLSKVLMIFAMGFNGFFQGVGWPGMMTAMANWFGNGKRGLLLAFWSINANVGNIVGLMGCSIIQNQLKQPWTTNFFFASVFTCLIAVIVVLFLQPKPEPSKDSMIESIVEVKESEVEDQPPQRDINIFTVFLVPRVPFYVISYSLVKACVNGLLFWLPTYLAIKQLSEQKAYISSMNDVGTFIGGVIVGILGDRYGHRALFLSPLLLVGSILMLLVWQTLGQVALPYYFLIFGIGLFIGGPYQIIGSAITVDLGQDPTLKGQVKAVSVISAVVEGSAAIVSAVSLLVIPLVSLNWLFMVFFAESLVATLLLTPLFLRDLKSIRKEHQSATYSTPEEEEE